MTVRFNAQNEDKAYLEKITKEKHGDERKELLETLSPIAAQKVRNSDEGWTRLLEYLMTEEHDVAIPSIPPQPKRLLHIEPTDSFMNAEVTDSADLTISEYQREPSVHEEKSETTSSTVSSSFVSNSKTSKHSLKSRKSTLSKMGSKSSSVLESSESVSQHPPMKEPSERVPSVHQLSVHEPSAKSASKHESSSSSYNEKSELPSTHELNSIHGEFTDKEKTQSELSESSSTTKVKSLPPEEYSVSSKRPSSHHAINEKEEDEEKTKELSQPSETIGERLKRHIVEISDWSEYLRFKEARTCKQKCFKCCVLTLLLLILLLVCLLVYMSLICCFGSIAGFMSGANTQKDYDKQVFVQNYNDTKIIKQLGDFQQTLFEFDGILKEEGSKIAQVAESQFENVKFDEKIDGLKSQLRELFDKVENEKLNINFSAIEKPDFSEYLEKLKQEAEKIQALQAQINQFVESKFVTPSELSKLEKQIADQQALILSLNERIDSFKTEEANDEIDEIFDNFVMLNADPKDIIKASKSLTPAMNKAKITKMLTRNYQAGNCYPTASQAFVQVQLKYPARPRYLVIGHPYAKSLSNGRESAPRRLFLQVKVRTEEGEETRTLEEMEFDVNGKKEQAFDLMQYGLSEDDVILGFKLDYAGDYSKLCAYFIGLFGEYEKIERR